MMQGKYIEVLLCMMILLKELKKLKDFEKLITEGRIYVDKTDLIYSLAINNSQPIFLSRPRRFGKSLLVSTFECLFQQKHISY